MESKKINQLATEMLPATTDLTIIGDPITGVSKKVTLEQISSLFSGLVSFYTNYASFPATGAIDTIYCAKDTNKLYLWNGSYVEVFPSQALLNTYQLKSEKGVSNGYASLDSSGKVPIAQLPSSIMEYKGMWSATTNTPTLANGTGDTGDVYICNGAGSVNFGAGAITFAVGDYVVYSGTIWQRSSGAVGTVTSVGLSSATSGVTIGSTPITTSGTITLAIATATTSQNGLLSSTDWATFNAKQNAITLTTTGTSGVSTLVGATLNIPNYGSALTGYVPYTGAIQDVDLGAFKLNAQSLHAKGTGGLGHIGLKHQSASATASANEVSLFADSLGDLAWLNGNLYLSKFITSSNTANRSYTFPNASGTIALTSDISYPVTSVFGRTGAVVATSGDYTTTLVTEGTNLYYTDVRARASNSFVAGSGAYNSTTGVITIPTNNNQITNGAGYITLSSLSATTPLGYNNTTGVFSIQIANTSQSGYLSSTDWNIFNNKQTALGFTPIGGSGSINYISKFTGSTTISQSGIYEGVTNFISIGNTNTSYNLDVSGTARFTNNVLASSFSTNSGSGITIGVDGSSNGGALKFTQNISASVGGPTESSISVYSNSKFIFYAGVSSGVYRSFYLDNSLLTTNTVRTYSLPDASGTLALTSQLNSGTVTSVAALTLGTAGTDLSSSVATGTTTPVITLNVPTASASNRGALSSADWTTFNNKQSALTNPVTGTGTSGYVSYFNGTSSVTGSANYFWDATNNRLGIGLTNPQRSLEIYSATADSHLRLSGAAPSVSLGEAITGAIYQAKFGLATGSGQYVSGAVAGDFVIISQTGATIWATSGGEKMRLTTAGALGIGTSSPSYTLDVTGTGRFTSTLYVGGTSGFISDATLIAQINTPASSDRYFAVNNNGSYGLVMGYTTTGNRARIANISNTPMTLETNNTIALTLAANQAATFSSSVGVGGVPTGTYGALSIFGSGISLKDDYSGKIEIGRYSAAFPNAYIKLGANANSLRITNNTDSADLVTFTNGGNVGINTTSPTTYSLSGTHTEIFGGSTYSFLHVNTTTVKSFLASNESALLTALFTFSAHPLTFGTSNTERMRITSGGDVIVGATSSAYNAANRGNISVNGTSNAIFGLMVGGTAKGYYYHTGTHLYINNDVNGGNIYATAYSGGVVLNSGATSWTSASDERLKNITGNIDNAINSIMTLRTIKHTWKSDKTNKEHLSLIAQDVEKVFPQVIDKNVLPSKPNEEQLDETEYLGVRYTELIPVLVAAIQEQQKQIEELKAKIK